jgi:hypothetical protein
MFYRQQITFITSHAPAVNTTLIHPAQKFQILGFEHYADYVGYLGTNALSNHTADLDFLFNDDKENYND